MRLALVIGVIASNFGDVIGVETTLEHRIHRHKHGRVVKEKPLESLSQLLARSAELTKAFEKQSADLHSKVEATEEVDTDAELAGVSSFLEKGNHHSGTSDVGLRAMEAVTNEIMQFTDKMRRMGNEVSLFSSK